MKAVVLALLITIIFPSVSIAASKYIKVTNTTSKTKLRKIKSKLSSMGLKMALKTKKRTYYVYSGPFKSSKSANRALRKIKRYFPYARIMNTKKKKRPSRLSPKQPEKDLIYKKPNDTKVKVDNNIKNGYFIGAGIGYGMTPSTHEIVSGTVEINTPTDTGLSYTIDSGYTFENGLVLSFAYMNVGNSDMSFNNIYGSLDYKFGPYYENLSPYIGVLGGYSMLKWKTEPLKVTVDNDSNNDSTSFFSGAQFGIMYDIFDSFSLYTAYQFMLMGHVANLDLTKLGEGAKSKLQHNTIHNLNFGLRMNF